VYTRLGFLLFTIYSILPKFPAINQNVKKRVPDRFNFWYI